MKHILTKNKAQKQKDKITLPQNISQQQFEQIKASFDLFDTDQGGYIDTSQLKQAMISLGFQTKNHSIFNMLCSLDTDNNGVITFDQWLKLMTSKSHPTHTRQHYNKIFKSYDIDNYGYICAGRLQDVAKELGEDITHEQIVQMIKRADKDIDGLISPQEFYVIMTKKVQY